MNHPTKYGATSFVEALQNVCGWEELRAADVDISEGHRPMGIDPFGYGDKCAASSASFQAASRLLEFGRDVEATWSGTMTREEFAAKYASV